MGNKPSGGKPSERRGTKAAVAKSRGGKAKNARAKSRAKAKRPKKNESRKFSSKKSQHQNRVKETSLLEPLQTKLPGGSFDAGKVLPEALEEPFQLPDVCQQALDDDDFLYNITQKWVLKYFHDNGFREAKIEFVIGKDIHLSPQFFRRMSAKFVTDVQNAPFDVYVDGQNFHLNAAEVGANVTNKPISAIVCFLYRREKEVPAALV